MLEATIALGKAIISAAWNLMSFTVPGFTFTFRQMWLGIMICSLSVLVFRSFFGGGFGGTGYRSGQSRNKHISDNRKSDEK